MDKNENTLIRKAIAGDAAAFNTLMGMHEQRMYAVALRMCGNREDAQDCLQNSMLRIYRSISSFKGESAFSTWAYRITMNTCLDELRRQKKKRQTSMDELLEVGWTPKDPNPTPEQHAMRSELKASLNQAINDLPEDMRSAIILRDIHGYSYEDIAEMLNANVGTIKSRISRGREKLRAKIKERPELFGDPNV